MDFKKISQHPTPEESPGYLLWRASLLWRKSLEAVLKPLNLTHPQFVVLASVAWLTRGQAKTSQVAIGRQAGLDPNTTSQILRGLQAKKFIKRKLATDERSKHPSLTELGSEVLAKALPLIENADAEFFSALNLKESGIVQHLQKLARIHSE